ncbi:MAG: FeoA family protein [Chitinophagaceae bacterium]
MKLSDLKTGAIGVIAGFNSEDLELKLMEMGCIPGEIIMVEQVAPMGGPMNIRVAGYMLSLRKDEAEKILIEPLK